MESKWAWLTPPPLHNSSCSHPRYLTTTPYSFSSIWHMLQSLFIFLLTVGILGANLLVIFVLNSRRYSKYIHAQPRYLLTSLACNDLAIGLFVTPFGFLAAFFHCWPYGEIVCQIQSLLRGALRQQSAVILICMALDRYMCMLHPGRYHKHSSKKGCVAIISLFWIGSVSVFAFLVLPRGGYYFNSTGLLACEPFFFRPSLRILASCLFYFPTTMMLMYCYGSAFHVNKLGLKQQECNDNQTTDDVITGAMCEKSFTQERRLSVAASRTMASMSLGFIVMVTPWTIQEVVAACTGSIVPPFLDFLITWLAVSNSFWNPFLYWTLNSHFRRISKELLLTKVFCRRQKQTLASKGHCCSNSSSIMTPPPPPPPQLPSTPAGRADFSEKYWGEILERTVSSSSLQTLQRVYGQPCPHAHHNIPPPPPPRANGTALCEHRYKQRLEEAEMMDMKEFMN